MANSIIGRDMAVDLGTANTLVYVRGKGVLLDEPSVVALNDSTGEILAVGHEAKRMIGRTPDNITAIRPLKDGVIADFDSTEQMLRFFIQQVHRRRYFTKPRLVICVPSGITDESTATQLSRSLMIGLVARDSSSISSSVSSSPCRESCHSNPKSACGPNRPSCSGSSRTPFTRCRPSSIFTRRSSWSSRARSRRSRDC